LRAAGIAVGPWPVAGQVGGEELAGEGGLAAAGGADDDGLTTVDFAGQKVEIALTFCVDQEGRPFDPADPEGKLRL